MELTIIGERLNSSRVAVARALEERDSQFIEREALCQIEAGAEYVDINAGAFVERETELLLWMAGAVRESTGAALSLDTTSPDAAAACLERFPERILLNSLTGEKSRLDAFVPLVGKYGCRVLALCVDEAGLPRGPEETVRIAGLIVDRLRLAGVAADRVYLDPAVRPISLDPEAGVRVLEAIAHLKQQFPEAHLVAGLGNVSYGLPARRLVNRTFAVLALSQGADSLILDPCDRGLMAALLAARAILNQDQYCRRLIAAYREGKLS